MTNSMSFGFGGQPSFLVGSSFSQTVPFAGLLLQNTIYIYRVDCISAFRWCQAKRLSYCSLSSNVTDVEVLTSFSTSIQPFKWTTMVADLMPS